MEEERQTEAIQLDRLLQRIRNQTSSGIPVQRKVALLLIAIDRTVQEQSESDPPKTQSLLPTPQPPLAYFGALITLLEQQLSANPAVSESAEIFARMNDESEENQQEYADREEMVTAIMTLLSLVFTKINSHILRLKLSQIAETLSQISTTFSSTSSSIARDTISCIESILLAMDLATWNISSISAGVAPTGRGATLKSLTQTILQFSLDPRPKVRKRAQDAVKRVLLSPPPPSLVHPFMGGVVTYFTALLLRRNDANAVDSSSGVGGKKTVRNDNNAENSSQILDGLVFLKSLGHVLSGSTGGGSGGGGDDKMRNTVAILCNAILTVGETASGNIVLTQWVFQVLTSLLSLHKNNNNDSSNEKLNPPKNISLQVSHTILEKALSNLRPYSKDASLAPVWLMLVETAFVCTAAIIDRDGADTIHTMEVKKYANTAYADLIVEFYSTDFNALLGVSFGSSGGPKRAITEKAIEAFVNVAQAGILDFMVESAALNMRHGRGNSSTVNIWAGVFSKIAGTLNNAITGVAFRENWGAILLIVEAFFERIGTIAPNLVDKIVSTLISIRDSPNYSQDYPFKAELDSALEAAACSMTLERFTITAPLNIFDVPETETRRPYLLSLFARAMKRNSSVTATFGASNLSYFSDTILPLYKALQTRSADLKAKNLAHPAKLFETLATQAFALFPAIAATTPSDLVESFDALAPQLISIVQTQSEALELTEDGLPSENDVRPLVYVGLQSLVEEYTQVSARLQEAVSNIEDDSEDGVFDRDGDAMERQKIRDDFEAASQGCVKLTQSVNKFLSLFCTIYTTPPDWILKTGENKAAVLQVLHERGQAVLEGCIRAFLQVADGKAVTGYFFQLVKSVLQVQNAAASATAASLDDVMDQEDENNDQDKKSKALAEQALMRLKIYSMIDLLCVLLPFLPEVKAIVDVNDSESHQDNSTVPSTIPTDSPIHLFYRLLSGQLRDSDATLQKKTYKALNLVMTVFSAAQQTLTVKDLMKKLIDPEVILQTTSGVKRPRMRLIQIVFEAAAAVAAESHHQSNGIEDDYNEMETMLLDFVPVVLSEVMLCTKEASEKARTAAYECLVAMGRKMLEIGIRTKRDAESKKKKQNFDEETLEKYQENDGGVRKVSLREYMMMVVAGLAGTSTNMQSAAIACCGRLIFEFCDAMDHQLIKELVSTVLLFMSSPNREIVKAALGFIKVTVLTVPQEALEDDLESIVKGMLESQSKANKSHLKAMVRNVLERLIRKFSFEVVEGFVPAADARLIRNIRKIRERAIKKKDEKKKERGDDKNAGSDDDVADVTAAKLALKTKKGVTMQSKQREFEDALHGSDNEQQDSDDNADDDHFIPDQFKDAAYQKKAKPGTAAKSMIREDNESVVDFLDSQVISHVTSAGAAAKAGNKSLKRKGHTEFNVNDEGRIMIAESDDDAVKAMSGLSTSAAPADGEVQEDYYKEAITGEGAYKRMPDGSVKFVNKRKRVDEDEDARIDRLNAGASNLGGYWGAKFNNNKKKAAVGIDEATKAKMLGQQYKSKKAKGDVKRANMPDPYAYIPMSGKIVGNKKKATELSKDYKDVLKASLRTTDVKSRGDVIKVGDITIIRTLLPLLISPPPVSKTASSSSSKEFKESSLEITPTFSSCFFFTTTTSSRFFLFSNSPFTPVINPAPTSPPLTPNAFSIRSGGNGLSSRPPPFNVRISSRSGKVFELELFRVPSSSPLEMRRGNNRDFQERRVGGTQDSLFWYDNSLA
ncbi:hypothetical protein HK100_005093, partial [Physocladia obscura]